MRIHFSSGMQILMILKWIFWGFFSLFTWKRSEIQLMSSIQENDIKIINTKQQNEIIFGIPLSNYIIYNNCLVLLLSYYYYHYYLLYILRMKSHICANILNCELTIVCLKREPMINHGFLQITQYHGSSMRCINRC